MLENHQLPTLCFELAWILRIRPFQIVPGKRDVLFASQYEAVTTPPAKPDDLSERISNALPQCARSHQGECRTRAPLLLSPGRSPSFSTHIPIPFSSGGLLSDLPGILGADDGRQQEAVRLQDSVQLEQPGAPLVCDVGEH